MRLDEISATAKRRPTFLLRERPFPPNNLATNTPPCHLPYHPVQSTTLGMTAWQDVMSQLGTIFYYLKNLPGHKDYFGMEIIIEVGDEDIQQQIKAELDYILVVAESIDPPLNISKILVPMDFQDKIRELTGDNEYKFQRGLDGPIVSI